MPDPLLPATAAGMLARIEPDWTLVGRERLPAGHHHTERLTVDTASGRRDCVLKAAPAGEATGLGLETRLLAVLADRTAIPVPGVYGVVDDHDDYPAPFAVVEAAEGRAVDAFGFLDHRDTPRDGSRPPGDPALVTVDEPAESWLGLLRTWADDRIDALEGPFEPAGSGGTRRRRPTAGRG